MNSIAKMSKNIGKILGSIVIALLIGTVFLLLQGENPLEIYYYLLIQPLTSTTGILKALGRATPLIFTGLAVAVSFKCGLFNIGAEGQLLFGGLCAAVVGHFGAGLPSALLVVLSVLAGVAAGMLYSFIPGLLKVKLNVHEVISTIMLNNIAGSITALIIVHYFRDAGETARTPFVADGARLAQFDPPEHLNVGFIIAVACVIIVYLLLYRTPLGLKIDAVGKNLVAAQYSGISGNKVMMIIMLISGALAGLCGSERILGAYGYMLVNFSPGYGFSGITVAVIGRNNPLGALAAAVLIGIMQTGGTTISMMTDVPYEWVQALVAIIFILVAAQDEMFKSMAKALFKKRAQEVKA